MSAEISPQFNEQIQKAYFAWLTTVRADGMPQPTPVWFIRDGDTFLIYSMPNAQKVRNIRQNAKVALSIASDDEAGAYVVIMGEAQIDTSAPLAHQMPAYVAKYANGIHDLNMTPESMAQSYSTPIRITPTQVRGE
jgi:PPOX class probable F420-dependent enzyme